MKPICTHQYLLTLLPPQIPCPYCDAEFNRSVAEIEVAGFLSERYSGKLKTNDREVFGCKEIDILLPEISVGIEFNGNYWHTETFVGRYYHQKKADLAEEKSIELVQIFEHEWKTKKEIIKSYLLRLIEEDEILDARETTFTDLDMRNKNLFLGRTHIQGRDRADIYYGLLHKQNLVACLTVKSRPKGYELMRYSSELGVHVSGGAEKLFSRFLEDHPNTSIYSHSDRRWPVNFLSQLGFSVEKKIEASPFYYDPRTRRTSKTLHAGWETTWDAGKLRWRFNI